MNGKVIAVEEAFATHELLTAWREALDGSGRHDPGFRALFGPLLNSPGAAPLREQLLDLGEGRLAVMDSARIDLQVLSVAAPGVQILEPDLATALAIELNDRLAEAIGKRPQRFAGLCAIAPQSPRAACVELERAVTKLSLKGAIINSHTAGEYLDDPRFWPIFEAASSLRVPIYLHPTTPAPSMIRPYLDAGLEGAVWGFAAETSLHALRLIMSGVFDRFPDLRIVLGHLGEGLPFWLQRVDGRVALTSRLGRLGSARLQRAPSEYFRAHFRVTTSGMNWPAQVAFCVDALGAENVLFAADHPYESSAEAVTLLESARLAGTVQAMIFRSNAEREFRLSS